MISIQTNVDSLNAQRNLGIDNAFQSKTIQQLTSGYRINKSGDDAAGLAVANGYESTIAQLNQGVSNSNDGLSQLQIVDGGLSNISTILNRLQTLATQSASATFTGDRSILNQEYSSLTSEITRQATNINLNAGGTFNSNLNVFIGGGSNSANSSVNVNLSGTSNAVDATSLGLASTNVLGGGVGLSGNTQRLDAAGATFLSGSSTASQAFTFHIGTSAGAQTVVATVNGSAAGITETSVLSQLNGTLNKYGITASIDNNGLLQFSGASAFNVTDGGPSSTTTGGSSLTTGNYVATGATGFSGLASTDTATLAIKVNGVETDVALSGGDTTGDTLAHTLATINAAGAGNGFSAVINGTNNGINIVANGAHSFSITATNSVHTDGVFNTTTDAVADTLTASAAGGANQITNPTISAKNTSNYTLEGQTTYFGRADANTEQLTIQAGGQSIKVNLNSTNAADTSSALATINAATAQYGVNAILNSAGTGIEFQGTSSFSVNSAIYTTATINNASPTSATAAGVFASATSTYSSATAPTAGSTNNAQAAIAAINAAIAAIGVVQGTVGAGENLLGYATNLAQSQIASFSSAESQIKDADVAAQAANLTKAQVLTQTSVAALAQANSEPQSILKLLQ